LDLLRVRRGKERLLISKIRKKKEESNKPKGEGNNYKFLS